MLCSVDPNARYENYSNKINGSLYLPGMSQYPSVYPSEINYRAGRIQTLSADQEIALKQSWAALLKYWGYGVEISTKDIHSKRAFVASSVTQELTRVSTNASVSTASLKKKKSFFGRKRADVDDQNVISDERTNKLKNSHLERYTKVDEVSDHISYLYIEHYGEITDSEDDGDGFEDSEDSDVESIETFYSAMSTLDVSGGEVVPSSRQAPSKPPRISISASKSSLRKQSTTKSTSSQFTGPTVKTNKDIYPFMKQYNPKVLHNSMMSFCRNDLFDNVLLRYIRARKYVVPDAIKMFANSLDWKTKGYKANELVEEGDAPAYVNGTHKGFVKNFTVSKSIIRGHDKNKNPLFIFQSRKHFASHSPLEETERFALLIIEWCRLFLREVNESVDTCTVMFDLTGFSMKNADNAPIKFLTSMFEAHYPESLGIVIIHNAPWIFSTVWNIIKNWLDPVVVSKIHFTKGYEELNELVDPKFIPSELGGDDDADNTYVHPSVKHTRPARAKDAKYRELRKQRHELQMKFLETTKKWVESTNSEVSSQYLKDKIYLSYQISDNYIALDPYVRNPGIYDRNGTLVLRN